MNEQDKQSTTEWAQGYHRGITDATNANKLRLALHFGNDNETEFRAFMQEIKKPYIATPRKDAQTKFEIDFLTAEQIFNFGALYGSCNFKPLEDAPF